MNDNEDVDLASEVESILASTRERPRPDRRIEVDPRDLPAALSSVDEGRPVIAEVKPTSPTTEGRRNDDPVELAREMVAGGAAALSVLTEPDRFGGSVERLRRVREAVDVPVLRKDFLLYESQLDAVRADAVLLIARFLEDDLVRMITAARDRGFQPLVEVHTRGELERALSAGADLVGVNNRDLVRLEVDLGTFERVAPAAPEDVVLIAESGIATPGDADRMLAAGADGLLVGSAIMDGDVRTNTRRLTGADPATERSADAVDPRGQELSR